MNGTAFLRIFWKEYRAQRSFWISLVVLTLVVELLVVMGYRLFSPAAVSERIDVVFAVALGLSACYALASGGTLFAAERDAETYDILRRLPVTPLAVFASKVVFALASAAALYFIAWMLALVTAGQLPKPYFHREVWALCGLGGIEFMAWGILFSLLLKRPLEAVIAAATVASVTFWFVSMGWILGGQVQQVIAVDSIRSVSLRLLILAIVAAADVWLATRWFRERRLLAKLSGGAAASDETGPAIDSPPSAGAMLGRLLWQEFRQSAMLSVGLIGLLLPMILVVAAEAIFRINFSDRPFFAFLPAVIIASWFSAPLLGSSLFLADQSGGRFRFLAEHGMPPRLVWLSRQIRGIAVLLLGLLLVLLLVIGILAKEGTGRSQEAMRQMVLAIESLLGFAVVAYACGQLCSLSIRSGLLAAAFGEILTGIVCAWAAIMYWLCLSWWWSVAPLLLAFMFGTWLHAPAWLAERKAWRALLRPALVIAVPALAILAAVPLVRVYEIPLVGPGFDIAELTRPVTAEDEETLALYQRAVKLMYGAVATRSPAGAPGGSPPRATNGPAERKAKEQEEQAVALALQASRRPIPGPYSDFQILPYPNWEMDLAKLVLASAERLQADGKLDAALDRYVAAMHIAIIVRRRGWYFLESAELEVRACEDVEGWAAKKGQTPQRVLEALRTLEKHWHVPPLYSDAVKQGYMRNVEYLQSDWSRKNGVWAFMWQLPWERARVWRLLNQWTAEELAMSKINEEGLASEGLSNVQPALDRLANAKTVRVPRQDITYELVEPMVRVKFYFQEYGQQVDEGYLGGCLRVETYRRATRLILALEAWKLEHGGLPKSLDDLAGKYLDKLPVDPYTGGAFTYGRKGLPYCVVSNPGFGAIKALEPGQPFIASDNWYGNHQGPETDNEQNTGERGDNTSTAEASSGVCKEWKGVWVFPIPTSGGEPRVAPTLK